MAKNTDRKCVYKWWFFPVPFAIYFFGKMVFQFCKMDPKVYRIAEWRKALDQTGYDITEGKWDLLINKLWENSRDSKFYLDMDLQVATLLIITVFFTFAFAQWYYTSKHFIKTNEIRISLLLSESQAKSDVISNN